MSTADVQARPVLAAHLRRLEAEAVEILREAAAGSSGR